MPMRDLEATADTTSHRLLQQAVPRRPQAAETYGLPASQSDPLAQATSRLGSAASPRAHASLLRRAMASQPSRARHSLLQLQRVYGNRYVQRMVTLARQADGDTEVAPEVEVAIQRARGSGQALDSTARTQMESAFGTDFSSVRVHTDTAADTLNRALNARAFTTGQDIFFRQGEYNPSASSGCELLAHELTHVVQQHGATIQGKLSVSQPQDRDEQAADQMAQHVMGILASEHAETGEILALSNAVVSPQLALLTRGLHLAHAEGHMSAIALLERSVNLVTTRPDHPLLKRAPTLSPAVRGGGCACGGTLLPGGECTTCLAHRLQQQGMPAQAMQRTVLARATLARQGGRRTTIQCINANLANAGIPWAIIGILGGICGILGAVAGLAGGPAAPATSPSGAAIAAAICIAGVTGLSVGTVLGVITRCIQDPSVEWIFAERGGSAAEPGRPEASSEVATA